jgi:nucleoside-diphosphate-sugar epimerase
MPHIFPKAVKCSLEHNLVLRQTSLAFARLHFVAIWGPGDPFSRGIPRAIKSGQFAFIERGDYPFATSHVDNVIEAVQCALERGAGGRVYFIHDRELTTFRDFIAALANFQGLTFEDR